MLNFACILRKNYVLKFELFTIFVSIELNLKHSLAIDVFENEYLQTVSCSFCVSVDIAIWRFSLTSILTCYIFKCICIYVYSACHYFSYILRGIFSRDTLLLALPNIAMVFFTCKTCADRVCTWCIPGCSCVRILIDNSTFDFLLTASAFSCSVCWYYNHMACFRNLSPSVQF